MPQTRDSLPRNLGRRRFLVGLGGACVALPLLESLHLPSGARAGGGRERFALFVRAGNGVQQAWSTEPDRFWPRTPGAITASSLSGADADRATSELSAYASRLLLLRGVQRPFGTPACGHSESLVQCLTAAQNTGGPANDPLALGMSADFRIAAQLHPPGRDPLVLMAGPRSAYIAEGLSWREPMVRASAERSPLSQYMRMMGLSGAPPEIKRLVTERRASVNDLVRDELDVLLGSSVLSSWDRRRLEQHRAAIFDAEVGMRSCGMMDGSWEASVPSNVESNDVRPEVVRRHMDVMALAVSCGYVRAGTLQIGEGNDQTMYSIAGTRLPRFHWISHRIESDGAEGTPIPDADLLHHQVDRLQLQMFAYLLERLDRISSPFGGTVLDDGVAVWLNDLGNGPPHGGNNVPWLLAGSCGGSLAPGRFVDLGGVGINRVLNTILTAVGCTHADGSPIDDFGDAGLTRGVLTDLLA